MPVAPSRIVVIGATSAIAAECLRLWASNSHTEIELILVGRNAQKLERLAVELRGQNPRATISCHTPDFLDPGAIATLADYLCNSRPVDIVLIAHGFLPDPYQGPHDLATTAETLAISGVSPCLFAEAFANHMERQNHGTLALIGSVAGDRPRKSNYPYGAAKGLMALYTDGLWHRLARTNVKVVLIKPGPTDTPLAAHHKRRNVRLAEAKHVARDIVSGIVRGKPVIYTPGYWRFVMLAMQMLPRWIFARMDV